MQSARPEHGVCPSAQKPSPPVTEAQTHEPPGPQAVKVSQVWPVQLGDEQAPFLHLPLGHWQAVSFRVMQLRKAEQGLERIEREGEMGTYHCTAGAAVVGVRHQISLRSNGCDSDRRSDGGCRSNLFGCNRLDERVRIQTSKRAEYAYSDSACDRLNLRNLSQRGGYCRYADS